jgi:hypothetical protein
MFVLYWYLLVKVIALVTVEFPIEVFVSDVGFFTIAFFLWFRSSGRMLFSPYRLAYPAFNPLGTVFYRDE